MTTVVELEMPASCLAGRQAFEDVPSLEFQLSGVIGDSPPLVWVSGPSRHEVSSALEADPSIDVLASLTDASQGRWLFRLEFDPVVTQFQQIVADNDGAILETTGRDGIWSLKLLFHDRQSLSVAHDVFRENEFAVTVTRMRSIDGVKGEGTPLTQTQYETILTAHERGYFDVPRKITLQELATELDISHQALSERLRRSHAALVSAKLLNHRSSSTIDP